MVRIIVSILLVSALGTTGYIYLRGEGLVGSGAFLLFWVLWTSLALTSSYLIVSTLTSKARIRIAAVLSVLLSILTFLASSPIGLMTVLWIPVLPVVIVYSVSAIVLSL